MNYQEKNKLNILVLYDKNSIFTNTVKEYLESFSLFSFHHIYYAHGTHTATLKWDLKLFDVIVIHYSVRLCYDILSPDYVSTISKFDGLKILFIQDEYDYTETARMWIEHLGINAVFSCVPQEYLNLVYPSSRFINTEFKTIITGYVPIHLENRMHFKPLSDRNITIGYRGRELAYWYGNLAREKLLIAQKMRQICEARGIKHNIEWEEKKRIYGEQWYEFMENCRATLGTESGSNVFDDYGNIRKKIQIALKTKESITYEEIHRKYIAEHDGKIIMNQISPRVFEAIALKTALILFEGNYSGVIQPDIHYLSLKKDFSNIDDVISKLNDDIYITEITNRAYKDIIKSGKYSYRKFINEFDKFVSEKVTTTSGVSSFIIHEIKNIPEDEIQYSVSEIIEILIRISKEKLKIKIKTHFPKIWSRVKKIKDWGLSKL
ncbi:hypothetical protein H5968_00190 [Sphaerospermopsis sp. LEGE 00249]|uniref:hypothetical protein n=1 Tax=Sphaerospermopsis sp. LEGE 00249 TaxID=1380707 RepID=UPI00164ECAAB|nr:hypothetical protein [Sphaerospermopsis sp. LEGE 00249]MBC5793616.1 hypothetical protein [Sphaerospermopsis sp. LEGE 00249]